MLVRFEASNSFRLLAVSLADVTSTFEGNPASFL